MSVEVLKVMYGRDYHRCKTSSISAINSLKDMNLAMLSGVVWDTVENYYRDGRDAGYICCHY